MAVSRSGDTITYTRRDGTTCTAKAVRVEGNLCWTDYGNGEVEPFIWRFHDGLNTLHDWPGKAGAIRQQPPAATNPLADCDSHARRVIKKWAALPPAWAAWLRERHGAWKYGIHVREQDERAIAPGAVTGAITHAHASLGIERPFWRGQL